jgi:hypothetical protein
MIYYAVLDRAPLVLLLDDHHHRPTGLHQDLLEFGKCSFWKAAE